jgi:hypothetical protein
MSSNDSSTSGGSSSSSSSSSSSVLAVVAAAVAVFPVLLVTIYNHKDKSQQLPSLTLVSTNDSTDSPFSTLHTYALQQLKDASKRLFTEHAHRGKVRNCNTDWRMSTSTCIIFAIFESYL